MGSGNREIGTGRYAGTGAAKHINLQIVPKVVIVLNETDDIVAIKNNKQAAGVHTQIAKNGAITQITSEGITIPDPAPGLPFNDYTDEDSVLHEGFAKFSLGTNAGVNGSGKECSYMAFE